MSAHPQDRTDPQSRRRYDSRMKGVNTGRWYKVHVDLHFVQLDVFESLSLVSLLSFLLLVSLVSGLEESWLSISLCHTDFRKPSFFLPSPDSVPDGGLQTHQ